MDDYVKLITTDIFDSVLSITTNIDNYVLSITKAKFDSSAISIAS